DVLKGEGSQVADVDVIIDSGSAGVHAHDIVVKRSKQLRLLGESVIEPQSHGERFFHGIARPACRARLLSFRRGPLACARGSVIRSRDRSGAGRSAGIAESATGIR